jgi:hypothetical protein
MRTIIYFVFLSCLLVFASCDSAASSSNETAAPATTSQSVPSTAPSIAANATQQPAETVASDQKVLAWVDNLNVRDKPDTKGTVVVQVKENTPLTLTGNKTDFTSTFELRGKSYTEPWVEVTTPDGKTGWVFQGAIKKPGEVKGNALSTGLVFDHFGTIELGEWTKVDAKTSAGGDAESNVVTYKKGNQFLKIDIVDVGEYGWSKTYQLLDANKKVLRERSMSFESNVNADEVYIHTAVESAKDYSSTPVKEFMRSNVLDKSWSFLNPKPEMATGPWKTVDQKAEVITPVSSAKKILGAITSSCEEHTSAEFNCSCDFQENGATLFVSDWGKNACVNVNGQLNALYPDWEERDYKNELAELAKSKAWISVSGDNVTYFGKPLVDYKYADPVNFLTDLILASGKAIDVIPMQTTTGGSTFDAVKAQTIEAIAEAKNYLAKGGASTLTILKMDNRSYDVFVRYRQLTQYEGEANEYEGTITLLPNRGSKIMETRTIKGTCGC